MAEYILPSDLNTQWASAGDILKPTDTKIEQGWAPEIPPRQWFNWLDNRQDQAIAHIAQHGVAVWSSTLEYQAGKSYIQGSDGIVYQAVQDNTNQDPTTDTSNIYWKQAFRNQSSSSIYALDTGTANTYKANYVPVVKTLVDGMVLKFKALNTNTGASTFTPANGIIAAAAIVNRFHSPLQAGEIAAGGEVWLQWNSTLGGGSWVMVGSTGVSPLTSKVVKITASGTYTAPAGLKAAFVQVQAAGGGGGGSTGAGTGAAAASGGSAGGYSEGYFTAAAIGASQSVTVGVGGIGGSSGAVNGTAGTASSFGALLTATGGSFGGSTGNSTQTVRGAPPNASGGGTGNTQNGQNGQIGTIFGPTNTAIAGSGGSSRLGVGGAGRNEGSNGFAGQGYGSGGAGAASSTITQSGGAGADGIVIITEYY